MQSEDSLLLDAPSTYTKHGSRMFSYNRPWLTLRKEDDTEKFKKSVITHSYDGHETLS